MQNKRPKNEKGDPHGYWDICWDDGSWYKGNFVNGVQFGYQMYDWDGTGEIRRIYYAR